MHQFFKDKIKIRIADGFPNLFEDNAKFHDAAYDSFVTGAAFIYMTQSQLFKPEELQLHSNKLYMLKTLYKGFYLDGIDEYCFKNVKKKLLFGFRYVFFFHLVIFLTFHFYFD